MTLFSHGVAGYWSGLRWAAVALFAMGLLRFTLGVVGVPIGLGGKATSLTIVVLLAVIVMTAMAMLNIPLAAFAFLSGAVAIASTRGLADDPGDVSRTELRE